MFSRAKWRLRTQLADEWRARTNGSAQTCDLRYFVTPTSVGRRQRQASQLIIPGVLSLRANRLLDRTKLSQRGRGRD